MTREDELSEVGTNAIQDWTPNTDATLYDRDSIVTRTLEAGGKNTGQAVCEDFSLWGIYDILITPKLPMLATKLPSADASVQALMENAAGVSLNTSAFNLIGLPALNLPVGFLPSLVEGKTKLPIGRQIISKNYGETEVYKAAHAWENNNDWHTFA
ncbi:hypothetical protein L486_00333 [Kwoniella mangroviensis CBS 10435]|uniref:Amidase domain-containing protein n=1 Tax=Kwoniella mangroviensis CBS 10435 TaxID=1331196 RepID=A0A1B9IYT6_9TREE|nr:hypothetical protein L486_00333 [Kwoniella mangroviensis CBS 10435]OCF74555.1 hypothetical protein I204_04933 [Kwoniella mangroviensis CBS 8886]